MADDKISRNFKYLNGIKRIKRNLNILVDFMKISSREKY